MPFSRESASFKNAHHIIISEGHELLQHLREYDSARCLLAHFENSIFNYLQIQNDAFYTRLQTHLAHQKESVRVIEFLKQDLLQLKVEILEFLDRFPRDINPVRQRNFPRECDIIVRRVLNRLSLEKDFLFPLFHS